MIEDNRALRVEPRVFRQKNDWQGRRWIGVVTLTILLLSCCYGYRWLSSSPAESPKQKAPTVTVSTPLLRDLDTKLSFLGQFAAVEKVELRAQVGGTLKGIYFTDGEVVDQDKVLFEIDPEPYEIRLDQVTAELATAKARRDLAVRQLARAQRLKTSDAGSAENVDQKTAERFVAEAGVQGAEALVRDARFDLTRTSLRAPFTGRIGIHQVAVGNLVSGSRSGSGTTTLLATLVSIDPIYLDFDMSESDYMKFLQKSANNMGRSVDVEVVVGDEAGVRRHGTLDFIDNLLDRSSGTIRARATIPNADLLLTPGVFARLKVAIAPPAPTLLVPDASVVADQSQHILLVVGTDGVVRPKKVEMGDLRGGLRVIRSGLEPSDVIIIDGIATAGVGSTVLTQPGAIRFEADEE